MQIQGIFLAALLASAPAVQAGSINEVAFHGFGSAAAPIEGEAGQGLRSIFQGKNFSYGIPLTLYAYIAEQQGFTAESLWFGYGALPSPWSRADEGSSYGLSLDQSLSTSPQFEVQYVSQNCFTCHAGVVAGRVVAGLGNTHHEGVAFRGAGQQLVDQWDSLLGRIQLRFLLDRSEFSVLGGYIGFLKSVLLPSIQSVTTRGDIHGPFVIWRSIARMIDPANGLEQAPVGETTALEALLEGAYPTVDPSPWWNLKHKARAFWNYDVSLHSLATFAINLMDPHPDNTATFPARMEQTRLQLAFARQTLPPSYKGDVDSEKADRGFRLFHGIEALAGGGQLACVSCHGRYRQSGEIEAYAERGPVALSEIGTDPAYATLLFEKYGPLYEHFAKSPFVLTGANAPGHPKFAGYVPPPLVGIWASAPYFHNGAVPTVTAVLDSSARPKLWQKSLDPFAYDYERLGLKYWDMMPATYDDLARQAYEEGDIMGPLASTQRTVYDTRAYGKSNQGHTFGDRMTAEERSAVVEYLKRL